MQLALERDRLRNGVPHRLLQIGGPGVERRAMQENRARDVEVVAQRVEAVKLVHAIGDGVGERILLRVDTAGFDHLDRLRQIHAHRCRAETLERACLPLARQHADAEPLQIGGRVHRPHPVGDMAEAVLEPAEDAVVHALLDLAGKHASERAVHRAARRRRAWKQERQVDYAELRDPVGQIARRLIAKRQQAMLDEPQDVLGPIAEVHDVPDVFDLDLRAEFGNEPVADQLERATEAGGRGAVAAHANLDWFGHGSPPQGAGGGWLIAMATPDAARPKPSASRMPPTPVAAASTPASAGNTIWPTRLPVIRSVSAVPVASAGARCTTPEMVSVEAMPMAKPRAMSTMYIAGNESGIANTRNPAALASMLVKVSTLRPIAKIARA